MENDTFSKRFIEGMEEGARGVIRVLNEGLEVVPEIMEEVSNNLEKKNKEKD